MREIDNSLLARGSHVCDSLSFSCPYASPSFADCLTISSLFPNWSFAPGATFLCCYAYCWDPTDFFANCIKRQMYAITVSANKNRFCSSIQTLHFLKIFLPLLCLQNLSIQYWIETMTADLCALFHILGEKMFSDLSLSILTIGFSYSLSD